MSSDDEGVFYPENVTDFFFMADYLIGRCEDGKFPKKRELVMEINVMDAPCAISITWDVLGKRESTLKNTTLVTSINLNTAHVSTFNPDCGWIAFSTQHLYEEVVDNIIYDHTLYNERDAPLRLNAPVRREYRKIKKAVERVLKNMRDQEGVYYHVGLHITSNEKVICVQFETRSGAMKDGPMEVE